MPAKIFCDMPAKIFCDMPAKIFCDMPAKICDMPAKIYIGDMPAITYFLISVIVICWQGRDRWQDL